MKKIILIVLIVTGLFAEDCKTYLDLSIKDYKSSINSKDAGVSTAYSTQSMASMAMYKHCTGSQELKELKAIKTKLQELLNKQTKANNSVDSDVSGSGY